MPCNFFALGIVVEILFCFSQKRLERKPDPKGNAQNILLLNKYLHPKFNLKFTLQIIKNK